MRRTPYLAVLAVVTTAMTAGYVAWTLLEVRSPEGSGLPTKARGHFPDDDAAVKLLWLAIINIEDKRARERAARRQQAGKRSDQPARLVEGQRVTGWREALNELDTAYPRRLR